MGEEERRESEGAESPESGPLEVDHESRPAGPMGTEDKHEKEAGSEVGEEDDQRLAGLFGAPALLRRKRAKYPPPGRCLTRGGGLSFKHHY